MDTQAPRELLAAWLGGELEPEGVARLLALCREQPELIEEAARWKSFDRLLRAALLDAGAEAFVKEVAARCGVTEPGRDLVLPVHWRLRRRLWLNLAAAAVIVIAGVLAVLWRMQPVAVVTRVEAARWQAGQKAFEPGERLGRGRLALAAGFAALRFTRGAELLVEGPADLELVSPDRVRLRSGRAFAHVPANAVGFTVEGPTGRVVDKGTDFGVRVGEGGMEVHVLKGRVEAGHGSALRSVSENEALEMTADAVKSITADGSRFLTHLPPRSDTPIGWIHWAFDEGQGDFAKATGAGLDGVSGQPARLLSLNEALPGPKWTTGEFGSALSFDGENDYVATDFPGIGGDAARTVAFWVKVAHDFEPKNGYAIVCWGSTKALTEGWQISINPKEDQGPLGRLRVARIGGPIIGTTDLRDDRWHHIAVVFYGGGQDGPSTQVLIYVDGEIDQTVRKGVVNVRTDTASPTARKVTFGLNIGPANPDPSRPATFRVFRGCLDEVFICNAALSQSQVHDLMTRDTTDAFARTRTP